MVKIIGYKHDYELVPPIGYSIVNGEIHIYKDSRYGDLAGVFLNVEALIIDDKVIKILNKEPSVE